MTLTARAVLKANRLFRDLPDATVDKLSSLAVRRSVKRGKVIPPYVAPAYCLWSADPTPIVPADLR